MPVLFALFIALLLSPAVEYLARKRVPRPIAAGIVMTALLAIVGASVNATWKPARAWLDTAPTTLRQLERKLRPVTYFIAKVESVSSQAGRMTEPTSKPTDQPTPVALESKGFVESTQEWAITIVSMVFLTFFLLLGGDTFKRKLVKLTGPSLSNKKISVQLMDDINVSIQKYLFMLLVTNVLVALLTWVALHSIGVDNAGAWAVTAGFLHVIPYLGPAVTAGAIAMAAYMQFESFPMAILAGGASLIIATFVGMLLTTWMTGRIAKMNSAAVFISLLFWSWLWGIWGMFLSIPLIVILKVVSEHVEPLHPVAEMLGE